MTAAAYLVLVERWIAAWVQDRLGPNRVGIPLTKIRLFGLGQPLGRRREVHLQVASHARPRRQGVVLRGPGHDLHHGHGGVRRDSLRQRDPAGRVSGLVGHHAADPARGRAGLGRGHDLRLRRRQHRRLRRGPGRLGQQQQVQLPGRHAKQCAVDLLRIAAGAGHSRRGAGERLASARRDHRRSRPRPARGTS